MWKYSKLLCVYVYFMGLENSCCRIKDEAMVKNNYLEPHNIILRWKSFKVYHTRRKGLSPYCNPFLFYILNPIKNNESKVVKIFKRLYFRLLQF
jgi:hypothetical protein